jgi:hypothetical protein
MEEFTSVRKIFETEPKNINLITNETTLIKIVPLPQISFGYG